MSLSQPTLKPPIRQGNQRSAREPSEASSDRLSAGAVQHAIRHTALRGLGFGGLLGIALIHLLDVIDKLHETPYLGVMYILLMIAGVAVSFALLHSGSAIAWGVGGALAAATLTGYLLSRTTGLPSATGDIGNWSEPLGLASMFVEGTFIVLSGYAIWLSRHEALPGVHRAISPAIS